MADPNEHQRVETDPTEFVNATMGGADMSEHELAYVKAWEQELSAYAQNLWETLKREYEEGQQTDS